MVGACKMAKVKSRPQSESPMKIGVVRKSFDRKVVPVRLRVRALWILKAFGLKCHNLSVAID